MEKNERSEKVILGIDPGTTILGFGVIGTAGKKPVLIEMGIVDLRKVSDPYMKLRRIHESVTRLIDQYLPDEMAIEAPFFGKNVQSMLKLGRAQGVAIAAAISHSVPVAEYAPRKVKMAITGVGSASKEQVAAMLGSMFGSDMSGQRLDATDGLATAVCHFYQKGVPGKATGAKNWSDFVKKNPGRVAGK
ncbi:MAG: crossover junction endodeoxyribonuclease RuvC [Bacteroidota bacterium]